MIAAFIEQGCACLSPGSAIRRPKFARHSEKITELPDRLFRVEAFVDDIGQRRIKFPPSVFRTTTTVPDLCRRPHSFWTQPGHEAESWNARANRTEPFLRTNVNSGRMSLIWRNT
jgi:hypothetical protein